MSYAKRFFCFFLLFVLSNYSSMFLVADIRGAENMVNENELISAAVKIAEKAGMRVNDCIAEIVHKENIVIVEFYPKNPAQFGGGGRVYFKQEKSKYTFLRIEHWQ